MLPAELSLHPPAHLPAPAQPPPQRAAADKPTAPRLQQQQRLDVRASPEPRPRAAAGPRPAMTSSQSANGRRPGLGGRSAGRRSVGGARRADAILAAGGAGLGLWDWLEQLRVRAAEGQGRSVSSLS